MELLSNDKMISDIFYILLGFLLLVKGGDYLVEGAVAIAQRAKLSKMVIGMTVVGFGTSMPELLVSAQSALVGNSGIAIGNVVGSNIANIGLILGVSSLIVPIASSRVTLRIDHPFMMLSAVLFVAVAMTGTIERWAGALMVMMLIGFVWYQVVKSRKAEKTRTKSEEFEEPMALWKALLIVVISFAAMVFGADKLVEGASDIAKQLGVSDRIIGLTIVAVGTSLPELFASVMASIKGESDMAIGNIIGSVTFNILSVIGISAIICPIHNSNVGFGFDYLVMLVIGVMLWIFLRTHRKLVRWEGLILTLSYIGYLVKTIVL